MMQPNDKDPTLDRARKVIAVLLGSSLALAAVTVLLLLRTQNRADLVSIAKDDPEIRRLAIAELTDVGSGGSSDSFPDPDVGRVMLPSMEEREVAGTSYTSNRYGIREHDYAMPKPDGTIRVVLLGDSLVFGPRVDMDERCGAFLERYLRERSDFEGEIECLQIGIGSWNLIAECEYARRQLSLLRPDVVVQVTVGNDLDDCAGVRGFGGWSTFTPRFRQRADSILKFRHPYDLGSSHRNWLPYGLDHESRERFRDASERILRLRDAVEQQGGRYMLLLRWSEERYQVASKLLTVGLEPEQLTFVPQRFHSDLEFILGPHDSHWNAAGNERVAQLIYGLFRRWSLLPQLELPEWDVAEQAVEEWHEQGMREADLEPDLSARLAEIPIASSIDFTELSESAAAQVHGGIDKKGRVAPYASVILDAAGKSTLVVEGRFLPRREIVGTDVRVHVEEVLVATVRVDPGKSLEIRTPLPDELRGRPYVSVRFESDDYAYVGALLRECRSFELQRLALE